MAARKPKKAQDTKLFVVDTNVLMHDPTSIFRFEEHDLFVPMMTLEELDGNKKGMSEVARNARQTSRFIEELIAGRETDLSDGVSLEDASKGQASGKLFLQTEAISSLLPAQLPMGKADNQILGVVHHLQQMQPKREVILVSKDINMRIKRAHWVWRPRITLTTRCWKIPTCCTPACAKSISPFGRKTARIWRAGKTAAAATIA